MPARDRIECEMDGGYDGCMRMEEGSRNREADKVKYSNSEIDRAARESSRMLSSIGLRCITSSGPITPGATERKRGRVNGSGPGGDV
jgi:hypothetical protein